MSKTLPLTDAASWYLQDTRQTVGNSMLWWRKNGEGYCCDVREAHVYSREQAFAQHRIRETDLPWPKPYIDSRVSHHIDFQKCDRALMLAAYLPHTQEAKS